MSVDHGGGRQVPQNLEWEDANAHCPPPPSSDFVMFQNFKHQIAQSISIYRTQQDAQLSQRDRAAGCVIVFAKSKKLELGDNDLRTL